MQYVTAINDELINLAQSIYVKCAGRITLAVAESCTGGLISSYLTSIPGASEYFICGIVSYSTFAKQNLLNVASEKIKRYDVVSHEVAVAMANGCMEKARSDIALSVTGVTGPGIGDSKQEVGVVCFAIKNVRQTLAFTHHFTGTRSQIRYFACKKGLEIILDNV